MENNRTLQENNVTDTIGNGENNRAKTIRGVLCTMLGGICWGFSGTCGQFLFTYYGTDAKWLTVMRLLSAGIILIAVGFIRQRKQMIGIWKNRSHVIQLFFFAIFGLICCQYTYLMAIAYSNAGTATILQYMGPVLIMIFVCLRKRKLPTKKETLAIVLALAGTFLLATHGNIHTMVLTREALVWGLLAAVGLAVYTLLPGQIIKAWGSMVVTGYGMLMGGIVLSLICQPWKIKVNFDMKGIIVLVAICVIGTVVAFSLYLYGVGEIGAVKASLLASVEPVSATIFAVLWMGSAFGIIDVVGFVCILSTVYILAAKSTTRDKEKIVIQQSEYE